MRKLKTMFIAIFTVIATVCFCVALASYSAPVVEPPAPQAKVQSIVLQYDNVNVNGTLQTDVSFGTLQLNAVVIKDSGVQAEVTYASSDKSVAEVDQSGLVTLKSEGETVISATVADKKHEIVLVVADTSVVEGYVITVNGGTASVNKAEAGETVVLTPTIPEDKEFNGWSLDDNIIKVSGNTFTMPATNVTVSANFIDKLASISVVEQPENNKIAKGGDLNIDGLKIMAKAALSGEEWEVTKLCTYSKYQGDGTVIATYTLGEVTREVAIPVEEVVSYTVSAAKSQENAADKSKMNAIPEIIDESFDAYKETGYIAGTQNVTLKFSTQDKTFCVSNLSNGQTFIFYFYSEVTSADYYKTADATYEGGTPNAVYETYIKNKYNIFVNAADMPTVINPNAKANAYKQSTGTWGVCGKFNDAFLFDMKVVKGWNTIRFYAYENRCPNVSYIKATFTGKDLADFAQDVSIGMTQGIEITSLPEDVDKELDNYKSTGAVYLDNVNKSTNFAIGKEGSYMAAKGALAGDKVRYYFYSEGRGTANVMLTAASSAYYKSSDATYSGSTPNSVREIVFKDHYNITINGTAVKANDDALIPAYTQETGSWTVCQRFVKLNLISMEVQKGWNYIEFEGISAHHIANLSNMEILFQYDF